MVEGEISFLKLLAWVIDRGSETPGWEQEKGVGQEGQKLSSGDSTDLSVRTGGPHFIIRALGAQEREAFYFTTLGSQGSP